MKNNRKEKKNELTDLLSKTMKDADSITDSEKKRMKKLVSDPTLLLEAMQNLNPDFSVPTFHDKDDSRTPEEIISDNYVTLAKFTIEKMQLKNVSKLSVKDTDCGFIIYALTPEPVELDFAQFATCDYPDYEELLLEAEALQSDLSMEDSTEKYRLGIIERIENAIL